MAEDGVRHALAFVTSAFGCYPGCRQYLEEIEQARRAVGPEAPQIDKLRLFYNHPGFIESVADRAAEAFSQIPPERRSAVRLIFTAHSIPVAMAASSPYESQLREACRLVMEEISGVRGQGSGFSNSKSPNLQISKSPNHLPWTLAFQSRSGPPSQPWLEPDVRDAIRQFHEGGRIKDVVIVPIGFLAENIELLYDLDIEVRQLCEELGIQMIRAGVVGSHPRFVRMIRELVFERLDPASPRLALGQCGPWPDECPADCCMIQ
jgi:ferrochelatase